MEVSQEDWQEGQASGALLRPTYLDQSLHPYSVILLLQSLTSVLPYWVSHGSVQLAGSSTYEADILVLCVFTRLYI